MQGLFNTFLMSQLSKPMNIVNNDIQKDETKNETKNTIKIWMCATQYAVQHIKYI